ncbi:MAG: hypothetical protein CMQ43_01605 [Gammaproteobacteria bacterium]|nr:hypothetical protein [Gammaproteobacteria bacterium]|tara:strand:- start:1833 stop:2015 length:183 start_codon:yes stop_codon:yes gene_type:complete
MDDHDQKLMAKHGITAEEKVVFHYGGHRYERLADAVNFAETQEARSGAKGTVLKTGSDVD